MVKFKGITSAEYKETSSGFKILYAFHATPFGKCLFGVTDTDKAVLHLAFVNKTESEALEVLKKEWPLSELIEDRGREIEKIVKEIFSETDLSKNDSVSVLMKGTEFQLKVWQSLMLIPHGKLTTYEEIAQAIDNPKAARAVGNAVAKNKVAFLVPCHRVMGKTGSNKYSWGVECKQNILSYESKCH